MTTNNSKKANSKQSNSKQSNPTILPLEDQTMSTNLPKALATLKAIAEKADMEYSAFSYNVRTYYAQIMTDILPTMRKMKTEQVENKDVYKAIAKYLSEGMKINLPIAKRVLCEGMTRRTCALDAKALDTIEYVIEKDSTGRSKFLIVAYADYIASVNDSLASGESMALSIAKCLHAKNEKSIPAEIRQLLNACLIFQRRGSDKWSIWYRDEPNRNSPATHGIVGGCFVQSTDEREYLVYPKCKFDMPTKDSKDEKGETIQIPRISYYWDDSTSKNRYTKALCLISWLRVAYSSTRDDITETLLNLGCPLELINDIWDKEDQANERKTKSTTPKAAKTPKSKLVVSQEEADEIDALLDF